MGIVREWLESVDLMGKIKVKRYKTHPGSKKSAVGA